MPIFEYHCDRCGFQKDYLRKADDSLSIACPENCGGSMKRQPSAPASVKQTSACSPAAAKGSGSPCGSARCPLSSHSFSGSQ